MLYNLTFTIVFSILIGIDESTTSSDGYEYRPMIHNEIREFKIDRNKHKECRIASLKIKKEEKGTNEIKFSAVSSDAYVSCKSGQVTRLETLGRKKCGIGKMLMRLCFNEIRIHNVRNNNNNAALSLIENIVKTNEILNAKKVEEWVKSYCDKVVKITVTFRPASDARVLFRSAIASDYTEMFFKIPNEFYPKEGRGLVEELKERYTDEGNMLENDGTSNNVRVWGEIWFFCKPRISYHSI